MSTQLRNSPLKKGKTLFLFDMDGTITEAGIYIRDNMITTLKELSERPNTELAVVTCSSLANIKKQLKSAIKYFNDFYSENGCVSFDNKLNNYHKASINEFLGEEKLKIMLNYIKEYLSKLKVPFIVGEQIDIRTSVINVAPSGNPKMQTPEQMKEFDEFDRKNKIVETFRKSCEDKFSKDFKIRFTKGGSNSFDLFPIGYDKTYCLRFIKEKGYDNIIFFGDNTYPGGADYDLAVNEEVTRGIEVKCPEDTIDKISKIIKEIDTLK